MHVEVIPATPEQKPILANLLELYAHDFSEFFELELGADGRFGYERLPLYWTEPDRRPFLVRVDGRLAGFVLVKKGSEVSGNENVWDVAEFFIVRGHRRRGVGTAAAHELWSRLQGLWEVRVLESNRSANEFWACAVSQFVGEAHSATRVEKNGAHWHLYSFNNLRGRGYKIERGGVRR